ncbi:MAG: DNA repair protein RecO [Treponema sp.]|nr:DNA repair protein RecO [Treponema sp.]
MSRHTQEQALVLTSRLVGEDNRIITLLGPERGIFEAMLYGGRKSKLRSLVSPWHSGTIWLYQDKLKNSIKISDFDPIAFRPSLRENIYKNMAASLATELVIKTHAADESQDCWVLFCGLLDGMELSDENRCKSGLLRFLWRYLGILGLQADCLHCTHCGELLIQQEARAIHYSTLEAGFLCPSCHQQGEIPHQPAEGFLVGQEAVHYLQLTTTSMQQARSMVLSSEAYHQLRQLLFYLTSFAVGSRLKTLDTGLGIL